jgi:signal transduction histidine kinase
MLAPADRLEQMQDIQQQVAQGRHVAPVETVRQHKDGHGIDVRLTVAPIRDAVGTLVGTAGITHDIGERKRAEEALRVAAQERLEQAQVAEALAEASASLASGLEPARLHEVILRQMARAVPCTAACIIAYSDGWAVAAGAYGEPPLLHGSRVAPLEEAEGLFPQTAEQVRLLSETREAHGWLNLTPWVDEHELRSAVIVPVIVQGETYGCLWAGSTVPGAYRPWHLQVVRAFAERIGQALWHARLHQLEQERARAAEHLASLRNDFVATVSHELRTPLAAVLGYAEMLDGRWSRLTDGQRRLHLHRIVVAANRQKRLIDDLLRVSTLEAERLAVHMQEVALLEVVAQAMDVVNTSYPDQPIDAVGPPDLTVMADASLVEQVLINLIDNAAKYSDEGSAIEVCWAEEDWMAVVRVRDHGPGIPEEGHSILFSRFGRVPGSRMRAGRVGTGLGLYLGRAYAEAMGGTLDLESTGAEGSTFCLRLRVGRTGAADRQHP